MIVQSRRSALDSSNRELAPLRDATLAQPSGGAAKLSRRPDEPTASVN